MRSFWLVLFYMLMVPLVWAQEQVFTGLHPDGSSLVRIRVEAGRIVDVDQTGKPRADKPYPYIAPGLFDVQINGYASVSFNRPGLTVEKVRELSEALWKEGVTTFFPTVITNSPELIIGNLKVLARAVEDPLLNHTMPGFFIEGPYISPDDGFRGAHNREWVREPDWEEFSRFIEAADGRIIQIGLAPEKKEAMAFIRNAVAEDIMVALAHHNGTAGQIRQAVDLGARISTHLGNGCANFIHRHDNPIWPQLADDRITPTIIADGHHLRPEELQVFYQVKGPDNLILVSDATELAGMPPGEYEWNGKTVVMTEDGMLQYPEQQVLAGASFPVRTGVMNMVGQTRADLGDALQMATRTPAKVYGFEDRGVLEPGNVADLILFTIEDGEMIIQQTVIGGETVYTR